MQSPKQLANLVQFRTGADNPGTGRPVGAKNKLCTKALNDVLTVWEEGGLDGMRRLMKRQPGLILRFVAQIMPKEITHRSEGALTNMSNEALDAFIEHTKREIAARSLRSSAEGKAEEAKPDLVDKLH
jgi:hypothetical protein